MNNRPKILVVGSLVMDLTVGMERFPMTGETVLGTFFKTAAGGKGANQAVQAARLGADVTMVGKVGDDDFGKQLIQAVSESGVDITRIKASKNFCTAIGNIQIENRNGKADNRICVVPGAQYAAAQLIYYKRNYSSLNSFGNPSGKMRHNTRTIRYAYPGGALGKLRENEK